MVEEAVEAAGRAGVVGVGAGEVGGEMMEGVDDGVEVAAVVAGDVVAAAVGCSLDEPVFSASSQS